MATVTKPKPKVQSFRDELAAPSEILEAEAERVNLLAVGAQKVLSMIEARTAILEPANLLLTPTEKRLLEAGGVEFDSLFDLCKILQKVRNIREALDTFSFEKLTAGRVKLTLATHAVTTTQADMSDLDIDGETAEPALVKQLAKLQTKLDNLRAAEAEADCDLRRQESLLRYLESAAPQCLKDMAELRRREAEQGPPFRQLQEMEANISRIEQLLLCAKPDECFDPSKQSARVVLVPYAREHCPEAITKTKDGFREICEQEILVRHFAELRETLPIRKAERDQLKAGCEKIMADAEPMGPIHDWIDNRGQLFLETLK